MLRLGVAAEELLRFLVSDLAQRYFAEKTFEYALTGELRKGGELPRHDPRMPALDYDAISHELDATLTQIRESGLTRFQ